MRRSFCIVAMLAAHARADAPNDLVARPIVLAAGQLDAQLVTQLNLAPGQFGSPLALAPDVWFGATARWTIGLVHSTPSVDRFSPAATFCVRHEAFTCPATYHGSGVDVRWSALSGTFAVAPRTRFLVRDVDPAKPALLVGALLSWTSGRFAISGDPYLQFGLANTGQGNRHALFLPITFAVQPLARWEVSLRTGFNSDFAVIRDGWHMPLAIATRVAATAHLDVGAMVGFASLLGPQNTAKERVLFVIFGWRT